MSDLDESIENMKLDIIKAKHAHQKLRGRHNYSDMSQNKFPSVSGKRSKLSDNKNEKHEFQKCQNFDNSNEEFDFDESSDITEMNNHIDQLIQKKKSLFDTSKLSEKSFNCSLEDDFSNPYLGNSKNFTETLNGPHDILSQWRLKMRIGEARNDGRIPRMISEYGNGETTMRLKRPTKLKFDYDEFPVHDDDDDDDGKFKKKSMKKQDNMRTVSTDTIELQQQQQVVPTQDKCAVTVCTQTHCVSTHSKLIQTKFKQKPTCKSSVASQTDFVLVQTMHDKSIPNYSENDDNISAVTSMQDIDEQNWITHHLDNVSSNQIIGQSHPSNQNIGQSYSINRNPNQSYLTHPNIAQSYPTHPNIGQSYQSNQDISQLHPPNQNISQPNHTIGLSNERSDNNNNGQIWDSNMDMISTWIQQGIGLEHDHALSDEEYLEDDILKDLRRRRDANIVKIKEISNQIRKVPVEIDESKSKQLKFN